MKPDWIFNIKNCSFFTYDNGIVVVFFLSSYLEI